VLNVLKNPIVNRMKELISIDCTNVYILLGEIIQPKVKHVMKRKQTKI
jgi:hypothetical protein